MRAQEGETATIVMDPYLTTFSRQGLGKPYVDEGALEFTGVVHFYPSSYVARLQLSELDWVLFDIEDALELSGPTEGI